MAAIALPEPQLRMMLARVLFTGQTVAMSSYALGPKGACDILRPAFQKAVTQTLPQWRANLVKAYRDNVPASDLARAASGSLLASATVLQPFRSQIGDAMERDSKSLLIKAMEISLMPVATAAGKIDIKKVDGATRMAEMKQAQADGSLFCDLMSSGGAN